MKTLLVGFHGRQESGKDTLSNFAVEYLRSLGRGAVVDRFAAHIYNMAAQVDAVFSPSMPHSDKVGYVLGKKHLGTRRNFLEKLGTEFGRELIHPLIWTEATLTLVDSNAKAGVSTVLADVRTKDEQAAILRSNGVIIHLKPDWPVTGEESTHKFTATKLEVVDPRRETVVQLKSGELESARDMVVGLLDSWCAKGLGLYTGSGEG